ncbi:MAG TPA: alpha/beta fold hydrolase [Gemmatimonadales bacterium]|nr:alpha/beta fold hydrolase [Gemmatimonadales bacterium]
MRRLLVAILCVLAGCRAPALPEAQLFPAGTEFTARYLQVDGTRIRYIDVGRGAPVLFLHGLGASMYAWRRNLAAVAAAGFRVIAFDNRGFGLSDKPPAPYDNAAYARLAIALMDSLRLTDAVLVGHSMGGAIAAQVAIEYPPRVRGLVLVGSAGLGAREPLLFRVARWPVLGAAALALRGRGFTARLLRSTYFDPGKVTEADVDQYYAPVAQPEYGRALRGVLQQFRFTALEGRLDRIAAPTLVLWGEEDRWVPMGLGRALAAGITRSAFVSVPRAGHSVQEEAPDEVNHLVIRFLKDGLPRIPADLALAR